WVEPVAMLESLPCDGSPTAQRLDPTAFFYVPGPRWHSAASSAPLPVPSFFCSYRCASRVTPTFGATTYSLEPIYLARVTIFLAQFECLVGAKNMANICCNWNAVCYIPRSVARKGCRKNFKRK